MFDSLQATLAAQRSEMKSGLANDVHRLRDLQEQNDDVRIACFGKLGGKISTYRLTSDGAITIRSGPSFAYAETDDVLGADAVFTVSEELVGDDGIMFLCLADGRGWIPNQKPGVGVICERALITYPEGPCIRGQGAVLRSTKSSAAHIRRKESVQHLQLPASKRSQVLGDQRRHSPRPRSAESRTTPAGSRQTSAASSFQPGAVREDDSFAQTMSMDASFKQPITEDTDGLAQVTPDLAAAAALSTISRTDIKELRSFNKP